MSKNTEEDMMATGPEDEDDCQDEGADEEKYEDDGEEEEEEEEDGDDVVGESDAEEAIDDGDDDGALVRGEATLVCSECGGTIFDADCPDYDPCDHGVYFKAEFSDITPWMSEELVKLAIEHLKKNPEAFSFSTDEEDLENVDPEEFIMYDPEEILEFARNTLGWKLNEYSANWGFAGGCTWVLRDAEVVFERNDDE